MLTPILYSQHPASPFINIASALGSSLVIILSLVIVSLNQPLSHLFSLRLTLALAIVDLLKSLLLFFYPPIMSRGGLFCVTTTLAIHWLVLISMAILVIMAVNMHKVMVLAQPIPCVQWERWSWLSITAIPTIILVPSIATKNLGLDARPSHCGHWDPMDSLGHLWLVLGFIIWIILPCLYCALSVTQSTMRLPCTAFMNSHSPVKVEGGWTGVNNQQRFLHRVLRRQVQRISLYCMLPFITILLYVLVLAAQPYYTESFFFLNHVAIFGLGISGLFNFLVFLIDPAVSEVVHHYRSQRSSNRFSKLPDFSDAPPPCMSSQIASIPPCHRSYISATQKDDKDRRELQDRVILDQLPPPDSAKVLGSLIYQDGSNICLVDRPLKTITEPILTCSLVTMIQGL